MRILFFNFWASKPGGAEISLIDIISEISKNHQTRLITSESGYLTENVSTCGCDCSIIPCDIDLSAFHRNRLFFNSILHMLTLLKFIRYCFNVRKFVFSDMPDIIHANVPKSHMLLQFLLFTGFTGKAVFHMRELFKRYSAVHIFYSFLFRFHPASVIAISHAVLDSLPESMKKFATVIYNGVDVPDSVPSKKPSGNYPHFLYLGRIVPWKGCDLLVEAFKLLVNKYQDKSGTLTIIGGTFYWAASYREVLFNKIFSLGLEKHITLLEFSNTPGEIYIKHSILCMPSDKEPFGRVAAEAMAFSLPVIGFNSGGLSEVVQHNETGLLGQNRTPEVLCALMEYFIINPGEIERMGANGRERCIRFFDKRRQLPQIAHTIIS